MDLLYWVLSLRRWGIVKCFKSSPIWPAGKFGRTWRRVIGDPWCLLRHLLPCCLSDGCDNVCDLEATYLLAAVIATGISNASPILETCITESSHGGGTLAFLNRLFVVRKVSTDRTHRADRSIIFTRVQRILTSFYDSICSSSKMTDSDCVSMRCLFTQRHPPSTKTPSQSSIVGI